MINKKTALVSDPSRHIALVDFLRTESPRPPVSGFPAGENQLVQYADSVQPLGQFSYLINHFKLNSEEINS